MSPALSPSRSADFMQCPLLYRFRVIDRIPEPPSPAAARGTLVHAALERVFDLDAAERTPDAAVALLAPAWADLLEREPELATVLPPDPDEPVGSPQSIDGRIDQSRDGHDADADGPRTERWLAEAATLVRRWFQIEDPRRLEPAERELYVQAEVDGLTLRGYVDRLDVAPDGRLRVVDYKTGRSPSESYEGKALFQMKFYGLVLWRSRGVIPTLLQLIYLRDGAVLRLAPDEPTLLATQRKLHALHGAIERAAETGDWRPQRSRLCDWCAHRPICPAWGGTPPDLPAGAAQLALEPVSSSPHRDLGVDPEL